MKLLTLLTTFIITLASSNVFAKTFVCENWITKSLSFEWENTLFAGELDGDTLTIRNYLKNKRTLTYFASDSTFDYYYYTIDYNDRDLVRIFTIGDSNAGATISDRGLNKKAKYDFRISQITGLGVNLETFCNYQ